MDRAPRIVLLGLTDEDSRHYREPLLAAGYRVDAIAESEEAAGAAVIFVAGPTSEAIVEGCRATAERSETAQVVACVPRDSPSHLVAACLQAGADDVVNAPPSPGVLVARARAGTAQAQAREERERARRSLSIVDELAASLCTLDLPEALQEAAGRLSDALGFTRCAVLALPGDDPLTFYIVAASDDPELVKLPLDARRYPELRAAIDTREVVFIEDAPSSPLLGEWAPLAAEHGGRTLLACPLLAERRAIGLLLLRSHQPHLPLDETGEELLRVASRLFTVALRGGRIAESLREQTRRVSLSSYQEERRLRALEQYRDFFETAADGVLVVNGEGVVLYINHAAEELTGWSRSGLQGKPVSEIVTAAHREGLADVVRQASAGVHLAGFDLQLVTTSSEPLRVSVSTSAALAEHGAVVLSFRDVTVARQLEDELRKTKDFLERLIDSTVDAIIAADIRGNVIVFNQGAERVYGYTADQVIGKLPVWKLYPEGVAKSIMEQLRLPSHGGTGRLEPNRREILTKTGEVIPVSLTASIIYEDGREVASVGIISDLRERLKIEQRLAQAQEKLLVTEKQALLTELAGTTAHELNQPLTSVMGYAELLKRRMGPDDSQARAVEIILREAERMAEIVRKIGKITRYETKAYVGSTTILDLDKSTTDG